MNKTTQDKQSSLNTSPCSLLEQAEVLRDGFRSLQIWLWTQGELEHEAPLATAKVHHQLANKLVVALGGESTKDIQEEATMRLAHQVANLNPNAGEIGEGKLRQLVDLARAITALD